MTDLPVSGAATVPDHSGLTGARRAALVTFRVLGIVTLAAVAVQVGLAGLGAFGASFDTHRMVGMIIPVLALLMVIVMLVARPSGRDVGLSLVLLVLVLAQFAFGALGDTTSAWFGALHAVNALAILGLAGRLTAAAGRHTRLP